MTSWKSETGFCWNIIRYKVLPPSKVSFSEILKFYEFYHYGDRKVLLLSHIVDVWHCKPTNNLKISQFHHFEFWAIIGETAISFLFMNRFFSIFGALERGCGDASLVYNIIWIWAIIGEIAITSLFIGRFFPNLVRSKRRNGTLLLISKLFVYMRYSIGVANFKKFTFRSNLCKVTGSQIWPAEKSERGFLPFAFNYTR